VLIVFVFRDESRSCAVYEQRSGMIVRPPGWVRTIMTPETGPSELRVYLSVLWRRKFLIAITLVTTLGATVLYTRQQTPLYTSSASVLVTPVSIPLQGQPPYTTVNMAGEQLIAASPPVAGRANRMIRDRGLAPGSVSVEGSFEDQTLVFTAGSPNPASAQLTAQSYANAYLEYRRTQLLQALQDGEDAIQARIDERNAEVGAAGNALAKAQASGDQARETVLKGTISSLQEQIGTLQESLNQVLLTGSSPVGQVVVPAYLPTSPSSPDVNRNILLGLLLGLSLGIGFAFLAERLDERLRVRADVEETTGSPLIARIPTTRMAAHRLLILDDPEAEASEAYRGLRARVLYGASQLGTRVVMLTSVRPGEGKTTTAVNLAAGLAQAGKRTVLVAADLRRPKLNEFFEIEERRGLTEAVLGELDPVSALVTTRVEGMSVLPSGGEVENPSELLGSKGMADVISRLADESDFVIVDASPVLGVSDAVSMASFMGCVLLVADARRSKRAAIAEAVLELRSVGAQVLGVVLTRVSPKDQPSRSYAKYASHQRDKGNGHQPSTQRTANRPGRGS
jgi:capsular exopolysaccharide synthesis family protein